MQYFRVVENPCDAPNISQEEQIQDTYYNSVSPIFHPVEAEFDRQETNEDLKIAKNVLNLKAGESLLEKVFENDGFRMQEQPKNIMSGPQKLVKKSDLQQLNSQNKPRHTKDGFPKHISSLQISMAPITCPVSTCRKHIFMSEIIQHVQMYHSYVMLRQVSPKQEVSVYWDPKGDRLDLLKLQVMFLMKDRIRYFFPFFFPLISLF